MSGGKSGKPSNHAAPSPRILARGSVAACLFALALFALGLSAPAWAAPPAPPQAIDPAADPDFEAALPPLDSIQAPPAEEIPAGTPPAATAPTPTPPATPAPATSAPAAADDADLAAPLPPLSGFDPTPDAGNARVPSEAAPRIRYRLAVEGLKPIGLEDDFRSLSALANDSKDVANSAQVAARANVDVGLAERLLRSEGYYDGVASSSIVPAADKAGELLVTISATPGPRYSFGAIAVTGADAEPTAIAREALRLRTGDPIRSIVVEGREAQVVLALPQHGYPFAKVGQRDILLDDATHSGDYTLPLEAGPRSVFGGFRTKGQDIFDIEHLSVFPRFKPGQLYDSRLADDMRQALVATSIFSTVAVQPVATGEKAPDGSEIVDLEVTQRKGPWRVLAGSAGYGTGQGIKAEASWTHRNLFPPEGSLTVTAIGGTQEQGASVAFRRANAGQRDRTFQIAGGFRRSDFDAYNANTVNVGINWSRQSTPLWQKRWSWSYGAEIIGTNEKGAALTPDGDRPRRNYLIGALPMQVQYDRSDDLLNPSKGYRLLVRASPESSLQGKLRGYARLSGQATGYWPATDSLVVAGRAMVSSIVGASLEGIAPSRRIYVGGGGSVRGFGYQQLGPKDAQDNPTGGLSSTEFALEARYRFGNFGIVPFVDAGRLGQDSTPGLSHMRYGAGIGGRYYTNFGPLRVDLATPIDRRPGESRFTLYISIGQAF
ncbi:MAG: BamA/TamA family outer membrane protein [Sphingomonas sp.]|nr:BamA/TamA family outer membrane protein [Sphingomonas sp.]MDX3884561.1 BamA/TamA family outer membrane protein [Sphingomonas sp.]